MIKFVKPRLPCIAIYGMAIWRRFMRTDWLTGCARPECSVEQQHACRCWIEDGTVLGDYFADLFVENELIVELKACKALADEHVAQLLGYLRG